MYRTPVGRTVRGSIASAISTLYLTESSSRRRGRGCRRPCDKIGSWAFRTSSGCFCIVFSLVGFSAIVPRFPRVGQGIFHSSRLDRSSGAGILVASTVRDGISMRMRTVSGLLVLAGMLCFSGGMMTAPVRHFRFFSTAMNGGTLAFLHRRRSFKDGHHPSTTRNPGPASPPSTSRLAGSVSPTRKPGRCDLHQLPHPLQGQHHLQREKTPV